MNAFKTHLHKFYCNESGAAAIEYGLLVGLLALALVGAITTLGDSTNGSFTNLNNELETAKANVPRP